MRLLSLITIGFVAFANGQYANPSGYGGAAGGPLQWGRDAKTSNLQATDALDLIMSQLTVDDFGALPVDTVRNIPAANLAQLSPEILAVMPEEVLATLSANAQVQSALVGEIVQYTPVDKLATAKFPWDTTLQGMSPDAINSLSPTSMGAVPWDDVFNVLPTDTLSGMSLSSLQLIPPSAWATSSPEQIAAINPVVLGQLPLSSLKKIPPSNLAALPAANFAGFSDDTVKAIGNGVYDEAVAKGASFAAPTHAQAIGLVGTGPGPARGRARLSNRRLAQLRNARLRASRTQ